MAVIFRETNKGETMVVEDVSSELSLFRSLVERKVKELGGYYNAHSHLDRAYTMETEFWHGVDPFGFSAYPLAFKQDLMGELHRSSAYTYDSLVERMSRYLDFAIEKGVSRIDTLVDASPDIDGRAVLAAKEVKKRYKDKVAFRIGLQAIFGFKLRHGESVSDRLSHYQEMAQEDEVEILGGLPEKDDKDSRPYGFDKHLQFILRLGRDLGKEVHMHIGQSGSPADVEIDKFVQATKWIYDFPSVTNQKEEPKVWAIHALSLCAFQDKHYSRLIREMIDHNIGLIVCPRATACNRQIRSWTTPMSNLITRVIDFAAFGGRVKVGTDNCEDIFVGNGDGDMYTELDYLATLTRFQSSPATLAKFGAGTVFNNFDRKKLTDHLDREKEV